MIPVVLLCPAGVFLQILASSSCVFHSCDIPRCHFFFGLSSLFQKFVKFLENLVLLQFFGVGGLVNWFTFSYLRLRGFWSFCLAGFSEVRCFSDPLRWSYCLFGKYQHLLSRHRWLLGRYGVFLADKSPCSLVVLLLIRHSFAVWSLLHKRHIAAM